MSIGRCLTFRVLFLHEAFFTLSLSWHVSFGLLVHSLLFSFSRIQLDNLVFGWIPCILDGFFDCPGEGLVLCRACLLTCL